MNVRALRLTLGVFGCLLVFPQSVRAGTLAFFNRCTPGALRACFSIQVTTTPGPAGNTHLVIQVRNQSGWPGMNAPQPLTFYSVAITAHNTINSDPNGTLFINAKPTAQNGAQFQPGTIFQGINSYEWSSSGNFFVLAGSNFDPVAGTIVGCQYDPNIFVGDRYVTCGGGWVVFDITTKAGAGVWDASDIDRLSLGFYDYDTRFDQSLGASCNVGPSPGPVQFQCLDDVTPEPVTMALLGTGLLGIGAARLKRRKRETTC